MHDRQLNPKRFLARKLNQNLRMIQLDRVWLVVFAFQSPHNLWLLDLLNYAGTCSNVHSCLWKNLHRVTDINRNWISEELLKLGRGQEICGRSEKFHFYRGGGLFLWWGRVIYEGEFHTPLRTMTSLWQREWPYIWKIYAYKTAKRKK